MTDHPITPPPELIQRWWDGTHGAFYEFEAVTTQAARWGWQQRNASVPGELQQVRDEELEACCEWLKTKEWIHPEFSDELRAARRPEPPSLAEEGYDALDTYIYGNPDSGDKERTYNAIRRALERLQELEGQGDD